MKISKLVSTINDDLFLPSIQREFVWLKNRKDERIEKLFDSIMQRYPIGNIMVWHITKPAGSNLPFTTYKFIENYNEDSRNEEASLNGVKNPLLVLDGQQRLTALLVGLKGSYSFRKNTRNFETRLYINLFGDIEDDQENTYGLKYEFKFLSEKKSNFVEKNESEVKLWLKVGSVLDFENTDAESYKISLREVIESQTDDDSLRQRAFTILGRIHAAICDTDINIVEIHDEPGSPEKSIDKVLNIFVRANDGGVKLEKSDLLLSFMESHRDLFEPNGAREEILDFVDELNAVEEAKPNYGFTKDDVLKASLMISGLDIKYKISNFTSENLGKISSNWDKIKVALKTTVDLLAKYKFSPKSIVSKNALFPLSYYIFYYKLNPNFVDSIMASDTNIKENLMNWLLRAMITGHFGRASDAALEKARKSINDQNGLPRIESMDKESIKELVEREGYCSTYSDLILKLVTPINHWSEYQQDHLHAKKQFSDENLKQLNLNDSTIKEFKKKQNAIGNICLLNPSVNNEKRASNLAEWIDKLQDYEKINLLIPNETNLEFLNFISFVRERESLIVNKLNEVLGLKEG